MKKILFLSIVLLFSLKVRAQSSVWCPPGATWYYDCPYVMYSFLPFGSLKFVYTHDTTIQNKLCKIINGTFYYRNTSPGMIYPLQITYNYETYYTYEDNSVIYLYNGNNFDTVVNFNANIGDKWLRPESNNMSNCNSRKAITVKDTGHISINGNNLKKVVTTYTNSYMWMNDAGNALAPHTMTLSDIIVERMMTIERTSGGEQSAFLFPTYCEVDLTSVVTDAFPYEALPNNFHCYQDNDFALYHVGDEDCQAIITVDIKENSADKINFSIYPNPASNVVTIELPQSNQYDIKLCNVLGVVYKNIPLAKEKTEIDVNLLNSGVYFLQVFEKEKLAATQKVIKE